MVINQSSNLTGKVILVIFEIPETKLGVAVIYVISLYHELSFINLEANFNGLVHIFSLPHDGILLGFALKAKQCLKGLGQMMLRG